MRKQDEDDEDEEGGANRSISGAGVLLSTWSQKEAFCQNVWEPQADLDNHSSQMSDAGKAGGDHH